MPRNLDHRIEVTCPVFDKNLKNDLKQIFEIQWCDNVKARKLDANLSNKFVKSGKSSVHSQIEVYKLIKKNSVKSL